jgi:hypothetical protein
MNPVCCFCLNSYFYEEGCLCLVCGDICCPDCYDEDYSFCPDCQRDAGLEVLNK